jgi:DNA replication protein DnaC
LNFLEIAKNYREVLDEAARKGSSMLEVLSILIDLEQTARQQRALERRLRQVRLPKQKTLAEYKLDCRSGKWHALRNRTKSRQFPSF